MINWRITFPIEKAEQRDDGFFLTGLASGPEIDATDERMDGDLLYRYADQINASGGLTLDAHLPYRDAHAPDGVLRDLGWLTKAWIGDQQRLAVEVKLDEDNPAAMYLFRALKRGKKYGMSVAGKVLDFVDEWVADVGKTIRTYKDVILTEISNTTRPAWTPSFGSVLAKAILDTQSVATGEDTPASADVNPIEVTMGDEILDAQKTDDPTDETVETPDKATETPEVAVETPEISNAPESDDTEKSMYDAATTAWTLADVLSLLAYTSSENTADLKAAADSLIAFIASESSAAAKSAMEAAKAVPVDEETPDVAPKAPEITDAPDDALPVEDQPADEAPVVKPDAEKAEAPTRDELLLKAFMTALQETGFLKSVETPVEPIANSTETPETIDKTDEQTPPETTAQKATYEELVAELAEKTAKVVELENAPPTQLPPVVERSFDPNTIGKAMEGLSREERLRVAMAAHTGGR